MKLVTSKQVEVGERMREALRSRGFEKVPQANYWQEVWAHGERRVCLTLIDGEIHDPVEAEVYDRRFRPDVSFAYNSKGLVVLLDREQPA